MKCYVALPTAVASNSDDLYQKFHSFFLSFFAGDSSGELWVCIQETDRWRVIALCKCTSVCDWHDQISASGMIACSRTPHSLTWLVGRVCVLQKQWVIGTTLQMMEFINYNVATSLASDYYAASSIREHQTL